ncbi:Allergen [Pleurostoma richardsiae]|uniref:Allergen n=1 Tax=Pleurostoma richardsiae TaxID=41990 RepID=A0AA38RAA9_9PEZI|nr:Allergen [Pleurostoma richardsiae]
MEKAKQAVANFVSRDGKHTTSVDREVRPAVTEEHIFPKKHENVTTAVDKEVHRDHHHTTVQPIKATEALPEKHVHNVAPVEHKKFEHGSDRDIRSTLERDAAKYKDTTVRHDTTHTASTAPVVEGEHTHHHVHEHIQPVIQKETIAPEVFHTTVPIHETHHAEAVHHGTSVLPPKTIEEFRNERGVLEGRGISKVTEFEGCPPEYNRELKTDGFEGIGSTNGHGHRTNNTHGHSHSVTNGQIGDQTTPQTTENDHARVGSESEGHGASGSVASGKAPLKDKLNPFKDADGDGKKGLMD